MDAPAEEQGKPKVMDELDREHRAAWAPPVARLTVSEVPAGALNLNIDGRQVAGALQGFGQLWQKTYQIRLPGVDLAPGEVMRQWKENFGRFQPPENRFYPTMAGIKPGEVLFIEGKVPAVRGTPRILPVATGVMILYVDEESFTVMTPEGHPESGWNTFSVFEEGGSQVAQIQSMARATDPIYEFYFRYLGSSEQQEQIWVHVLSQLAGHFGVRGQVTVTKTLIDSRVQWSEVRNIRKNAGISTVLYKLTAPLRWLGRILGRQG
jgi:hypothetical protein